VAHSTHSSSSGPGVAGDVTPEVSPERAAALARILARKVQRGCRVESQSETEATFVAPGRRRWLVGPRSPGAREIVRVDEQGRVHIEALAARSTTELGGR
jgi:hypothetical protein